MDRMFSTKSLKWLLMFWWVISLASFASLCFYFSKKSWAAGRMVSDLHSPSNVRRQTEEKKVHEIDSMAVKWETAGLILIGVVGLTLKSVIDRRDRTSKRRLFEL